MEKTLWRIVGTSLLGKGHQESEIPCQDAHTFEVLGEMKGIAIVSDGAGSCENSHLGSDFVVQKTMERMKNLLQEPKWINKENALTEEEWAVCVQEQIKGLQGDLEHYAKEEKVSYKSLSCTLIILIFSPQRLLVAHVGDGRAGYANAEGKWKSILTPFKGEQVGQTVFITSDIFSEPRKKLIETRIINDSINSFTLLSDGCELACWNCYSKHEEEQHYFDPNTPDQDFFDHNVSALKKMHQSDLSDKEIETKWSGFLLNGNSALQKETDDKTLVLGTLISTTQEPEPLVDAHNTDNH